MAFVVSRDLKERGVLLVLGGLVVLESKTKTISPISLCIGASLALGLLCRSFEGTKTADFFHHAFGFHLTLEALQRTLNRLAFFDIDFWHSRVGYFRSGFPWTGSLS